MVVICHVYYFNPSIKQSINNIQGGNVVSVCLADVCHALQRAGLFRKIKRLSCLPSEKNSNTPHNTYLLAHVLSRRIYPSMKS